MGIYKECARHMTPNRVKIIHRDKILENTNKQNLKTNS